MNLSETDKAYLAGFFDGEGTFSVFKRPEKRSQFGFSLQPYIELGSTTKNVMEWLKTKLGKGYSFDGHFNPGKNWKQAYKFHFTGIENIIEFVEALEPYLIIKKDVAIKLREFCLSRKGKMHLAREKRGFTPEEIEIFQQIRILNKRGLA